MLAPIPSAMLKDSAVFHVPVSMDEYQKPVYDDMPVEHVHIQNCNQVYHGANDEQIRLNSILFVDGRKSLPVYDYMAIMASAQAVGADITVTVTEANGNSSEYTVVKVDACPDVPATKIHHTEIGLV